MAKQTFTTGQVLTAAQMTDLQQTAMTGGAASTKTVSYVLVAADAGTRIAMNAAGSTTITVNTGLFSAGDTVSIQNIVAGVCTVTAGTATVNTSGSLVLAQYQGGILYFTSASAAIFFQFATPASGDIEGVTAGTGISGGGTSGTVTITNSMATAIDAKGDLVAGTGADAFARLAVGANGTILTADSAESTGLKWATAAGGGDLVKISSVTWSSASAQSLTSVFSATYDNYCIIFDNLQVTSTSNTFAIRLRSGSSNNTTSNYYSASLGYRADGTSSNYNQNPADFWGTSTLNASPHVNGFLLWVFNPYDSVRTTFTYQTFGADSVSFLYRNGGGLFNGNTSFDGLGFFLDAGGSVSGDVTVYGYKK